MITLLSSFVLSDWVTLLLVIFVSGYLGFCVSLLVRIVVYYRLGRRDGAREERSWRNAIVIRATAKGCRRGREAERIDALRPYRLDLRIRPRVTISTASGNRMPNDQGDQRCQAVGSNPEGEVPTTAPAYPMRAGSNPAPGATISTSNQTQQ